MKVIATIVGIGFLLVGVLGFVMPTMMNMHLSLAHNLVHVISGAMLLWFATRPSQSLRNFMLLFGAVYALLGIAGFIAGPGVATSVAEAHRDSNLLKVIPGYLEFGTMDSIIHIALGGFLVLAGLLKTQPGSPADQESTARMKDKVTPGRR